MTGSASAGGWPRSGRQTQPGWPSGLAPKALVNNHLGLPDGVEGPELLKLGRRHAVASGAEWIEDTVTSLSVQDGVVALGTVGGQCLHARDVLLAQGTNTLLAAGGRDRRRSRARAVDQDCRHGRRDRAHLRTARLGRRHGGRDEHAHDRRRR
ncbi:MAG TPA: hypothetical protein VHN80_10945 [Kineosporiaceae bacterium]|nr:hypothetical protein [Kineosporiaceae bacterium]